MGTRRIKSPTLSKKAVKQNLKGAIGAYQAIQSVRFPVGSKLDDGPTFAGQSDVSCTPSEVSSED